MAATWMNIVYGFGGLHSDGDMLVFNPSLPKTWNAYSFKIYYKGSILKAEINKEKATFRIVDSGRLDLVIYGKTYTVDSNGVSVDLMR
jgi:maltose phosphorylase